MWAAAAAVSCAKEDRKMFCPMSYISFIGGHFSIQSPTVSVCNIASTRTTNTNKQTPTTHNATVQVQTTCTYLNAYKQCTQCNNTT
jgi:hypothetical protein